MMREDRAWRRPEGDLRMTSTFDVIIVGAGTAGLAALREVRKRTDNFLLINDGPYGTTCARVGCMPSKALIEAANAFHRRFAFEAFGIRGGDRLAIDVPAVLRRVRSLRDGFVAGTLKITDGLGERNVAGQARLLDPTRVEVEGLELRAKRIVLASGSRPIVPDAWRRLGERVLTTDTLFEQKDLPRRIAVVGLGPVGVECAQALSRLGHAVVGFDADRTIAGLGDEEVNSTFCDLLRKEFPLHLGAPAELVEVAEGIEVANGDVKVVVDCVIAAMGRRPNVESLNLEALGVGLGARGLPPVDPSTTQIADLPVFLAGDASGGAALLHEAADEGHIAGINATAADVRSFRRRTPLAIVFSEPDVATAGRRYAELNPADTVIGQASFSTQGRARIAERNRGLMRIYADKSSGRLRGAEMCAPAAEHMAHLLALALERRLSVQDLLRLPFYHPVIEEGMRSALRDLAAQLRLGAESDLASCDPVGAEALD
jgi:dihydrolipoamide dehydrogenase